MRRLFRKPEPAWLIASVVACLFLLGAVLLPLWRMELIAPQYPEGLVMYAYGDRFAGDDSSHYDDVREINGLNHYIGMKPIEEVTEMSLFRPGMAALALVTLIGAFIAWKGKWVRRFIIAGFWFMPIFFLADLQYWLYKYGHSMDPEAPLNPGSFTPKVIGETKVWNFHSNNTLEIGFFMMLAAALTITLLPPAIRWGLRKWQSRTSTERGASESISETGSSSERAMQC